MVYPTLLAAISDLAHPSWRASALGVYRLWRDSGYAFGALVGGVLADLFSIQVAVLAIAVLTAISGSLTWFLLPETATRITGSTPASNVATTTVDIREQV
jgi:MFS family permease